MVLGNFGKIIGSQPRRLQIQPDHVRLHWMSQLSPTTRPHVGDPCGTGVCLGELPTFAARTRPKRLLDGHSSGGREHARLPDPTPNRLAEPPRLLDKLLRPDNDTADRGAETLRKTQAHAVKQASVLGETPGPRYRSFPEPRPVQMDLDVVGMRPFRDPTRFRQRHDHAVQGVFQADQLRRAVVDVVVENGARLDIFERKMDSVLRHDTLDHCAGERAHAARLVAHDMRSMVAEDGVGGLHEMGPYRYLVAHRAGHDQQRILMVGPLRNIGLEILRDGVLVEDVVQKGGLADGFEHGRGRLGHRVAWLYRTIQYPLRIA